MVAAALLRFEGRAQLLVSELPSRQHEQTQRHPMPGRRRRGQLGDAGIGKTLTRGLFEAPRCAIGRTPQPNPAVPPTDSPPRSTHEVAIALGAVRMRLGPVPAYGRKPCPPMPNAHFLILRPAMPMPAASSASPEFGARNFRPPRPPRHGQSVCRPAAGPRVPRPGGPVRLPNPRPIPGCHAAA